MLITCKPCIPCSSFGRFSWWGVWTPVQEEEGGSFPNQFLVRTPGIELVFAVFLANCSCQPFKCWLMNDGIGKTSLQASSRFPSHWPKANIYSHQESLLSKASNCDLWLRSPAYLVRTCSPTRFPALLFSTLSLIALARGLHSSLWQLRQLCWPFRSDWA